jgi:hypothetical protein
MKDTYRILIALLFICASLPASAQIGASLDRSEIGPGETVQLTLQHQGQTDTQPDLSPLKQDFEIVGQSSGSSIQIINGKMNSQVQVQLSLLPKHSGKLHIPALQWDGQASAFLPLTVDANAAPAQSGSTSSGNAPGNNVSRSFITETLGQRQPYVQAAVPLTVRLYVDQPLYQASLDLQPSNDVLIQQVGQDRQTSETRNGRNYQVIERKYLLFPQRSGRIQLDGPVLNAQVQDNNSNFDPFGNNQLFGNIFGRNPFAGMLNSTRPIRIVGNQIALNVRPRPSAANGHDWLPAQDVKLAETWQPDKDTIHAGDPVTLHLHLIAEGLTAAQLPDLSQLMQLPDGLRAYPDQPKLNTDTQGTSVIGIRDQDIALIANTPGRYEIPALHLFWWDTARNAQQEINLPSRSITVLPSGGIAVNTAPPPNQNSGSSSTAPPPQVVSSVPQHEEGLANNNRWSWVSLAFAILWLGTLAAWWRSSKRNPDSASNSNAPVAAPPVSAAHASEARKAFQQACRDNDPQSARRNLLDWADATWPQDPPAGLKSLAARLDDEALQPLLGQLDRACYTNGEWRGGALLNALKTLSGKKKTLAVKEPELSALYP